jgi:hypothetical protein
MSADQLWNFFCGILVWGILVTGAGSLIWALVNLRKPDRRLKHLYGAGHIPESRIIEMQPKRRIIEVPIAPGSRAGIAAISGIR